MFRSILTMTLFFAPRVLGAVPDSGLVGDKPFAIAAGFGVSLINATEIVDYVNRYALATGKVDDFGAAVEFFGASEFHLSPSLGLKLEYAYLLKSYNILQGVGQEYTFSYSVHMPSVLIQYRSVGRGYALKLGGGGGYHFASFSQDFGYYGAEGYASRGIGIKVEAEGNTEFDEHFFGYIAVDVRKNFMGTFTGNDGHALNVPSAGNEASMSFFSVGLKFGFIYFF